MRRYAYIFYALAAMISYYGCHTWSELRTYISSNEIYSESTPASVPAIHFNQFPLGEVIKIDLEIPAYARDELTTREEKNQVRDWALYTILSQIGLSEAQFSECVFDLPLLRYDYHLNTTGLQYGPLRSRSLPDRRVIALIPESEGEEEKDHLAHIADMQRKNLGGIPEALVVFKYTIAPRRDFVELRLDKVVDGELLFKPEYGYHQQVVTNLSDLETFLQKAEDLTFVDDRGSNLLVGGRKLQSRSYRSVNTEDIAALWQASRSSASSLNALNRRADELWEKMLNSLSEENKQALYLLNQSNNEEVYQQVVAKLLENALTPEELAAFNASTSDGLGFSLDSNYDFEGLKSLVDDYQRMLFEVPGTFSVSGPSYTYQEVMDALDQKDYIPLLSILEFYRKSPEIDQFMAYMYSLIFQDFQRYRFQNARYDGNIQGTEVGMTLFYTDLIAKLWTFNFEFSTPSSRIPEFLSSTNQKVSRIYQEEMKQFRSGRLWFGLNDEGIQLADDSSIRFARNATKVFAKSSNILSPDDEVPAAASLASKIDWFNNHLEEIAAYEGQYERLNELMKWSFVISWLSGKSPRLDYLDPVPVDTSQWFPQWIKKHPELKFRKWQTINFHPKGFKGTATEALPVLYSPPFELFGNSMYSYGGVTLSGKENVSRLAPVNPRVNPAMRRSTLKYDGLGKAGTKTLNGSDVAVSGKSVRIDPPSNVKLRSRFSELSHKPLEAKTSLKPTNASLTASHGGIPANNLKIAPSKNGFNLGLKARTGVQARTMSRKLSDAKNMARTLERDPSVERYFEIVKEEQFLIKFENTDQYLLVEASNRPAVTLDPKWQSRTAGFGENSRIIKHKWVNRTEAERLVGQEALTPPSGPGQPPKILEHYNNQNYNQFTRTVLESHNATAPKAGVKKYYRTELQRIDEMVQSGKKYFEARERIESLKMQFGERPEISMREALLDLNQKMQVDFQNGVNTLNEIAVQLEKGKGNLRFMDEVEHLINNSNLTARQINLVKSYLLFKSGKNAPILRVKFNKIPEGEIANAEKVIQALDAGNSRLYVQDAPGLNNLNWNASVKQTIADILELHPDAIIKEIPKGSFKSYRPEMTADFTGAGNPPELTVEFGNFNRWNWSGYGSTASPCGEDDNDPDCPRQFVLTFPELQ